MEFQFTSTQHKSVTPKVIDAVENIILHSGCGVSTTVKHGWFKDTVTFTVKGTAERCEAIKQYFQKLNGG